MKTTTVTFKSFIVYEQWWPGNSLRLWAAASGLHNHHAYRCLGNYPYNSANTVMTEMMPASMTRRLKTRAQMLRHLAVDA